MVFLPRQCTHCGKPVHHYGACICADAQLELIDAERKLLQKRGEWLDAREREVLGLVPDVPK